MARVSQQGIEIPVSLQLQNLQEIANSLKKFAGENILGDSINGKKINAELQTVLKTLIQIETRAKNGFKIDSDFGGLNKEINRVELSLDKVYSTIGKLTFNDLKVPSDVQEKINELNAQIKQLRDNFNGVKEAQKTALINNGQFALDLNKAFPSNSSKILGKTYDEIGEAIKAGTVKIQARLEEQQRILQQKQLLLSENKTGQINFAAQNVLDFLEKGFKELPKNPNTKLSDQQQILEQYMKIVTDEKGNREFAGFKSGASYNNFFNYLAKQYELTPEQLNEIKKRIKDQMTETKKTAAQVMKNMATDQELGAKIMVNTSRNQMVDEAAKYADQVKDTSATEATIQRLTEQGHAANAAWQAFQGTVSIVSAANEQLKGALQGPQTELEKLQQSVLENATAMPQLSQAQQEAAASLDQLKAAASAGEARLKQMNETVSKMDGVSNFINRYIGLYAIVRKVSTAIRNAFNNIKELDKTITSIAVVTNMSQKDLWGKIGEYTQMAQQYGVAVKGVYEVSQIFYQQGLQTSQVMSLTTETLKMAKIAGIDYSTAANAMTVAVRAFKIEMTDAQQVTDTYSALAAKFAVSSAEIANAMEKTASSAASVGMSLESTSAFISVMEQTTRESAQNIGSALKSIISRYGEMKASPSALLNVDGEEVAFNKVDTALKSIGISIKDASGQFRDFDDVIMELAKKWDSLDNNIQRYIATIMAGNRQQSRFIALVSNYDELSRAMDTAVNAENASIVQVAKTMDSLESKANQLQNAFSQLYLDLHIEDGLKGAYDWLTKILKTIGKLGVGKGLLPSLMNVIGLGTGTKKLIGMGKEAYQNRVKKIQVEVEDKNNKIQEIKTWISQPEDKVIRLKMDDSQVQQTQAAMQTATSQAMIGFKNQALGLANKQVGDQSVKLNSAEIYSQLKTARDNGELQTVVGRETLLSNLGIDKQKVGEQQYSQLDAFLQTIGSLNAQVQTLGTTLQALGVAAEGATQSEEQKTSSTQSNIEADYEAARAKQQSAASDLDLATKKQQAALEEAMAIRDKDTAEREAALRVLEKANAEVGAAQAAKDAADADIKKLQPAYDAAQADRMKAMAAGGQIPGQTQPGQGPGQTLPPGGVNQPKTSPWEGKEGLMKGIGVASSLARIAGTAITAAGAAHEDRSTDKYETSKILTGVGNGLSMAGTGASMGMAFGPWGAAIGAIGGFLVGGLGAIADGLEKTASEKLAQLKEKAQKASDDSLKTQAKAEDLSSRISNLKQLKKAMYDSNEDMQAYKDAMNNIASEYPNLISSYDAAGNAIIDLVSAEEFLIDARQRAAQETRKAAIANADAIQQQLEMTENFATAIEQELKTTGQSKKNEITGFGTSLTTTKNGWNVVDNNGQSFTIVGKKTLFDQFGSRMAATGYNYEEAIRETVAATIQDENFKFTDELTGEKTGILNSILDKEKTGNHQWTYDEVATWAWWLSQSTSGKAHNSFLATSDQNYFRYNPQGTNISYQVPHYTNLNTGATNDVYNALTDMGSFYDNMINYQNEMEFQGSIKTLDEFIETNKELLGTSASTAAEYFDWGEDGPTREDVRQALLEIQRMSEQLKITKQSLDTQASKANATEYFNNAVQNYDQPVMAGRKAQVIDNNLYSNLVYKNLELSAKEKDYTSGIEWSNSNKVDYQAAATSISEEISAIILKMSDSELDIFNSVMSDLTVFTDINSVFKKLGINETDRQTKFALGIIEQFKIDNEKNRDRLLGTIYNLDKNGRVPFVGGRNDAFKTLWRFNDKNGTELLKIIGSHFLTKEQGGAEDIITKYSDYFTTSIVSINKLAEDGYTELAYNRLQILSDFSTSLAQMSDQEQQDMFGILTQVDFSNYESIQAAKESLTKYTKEKGITIEDSSFEGLWDALEDAENKLIFNITTLANTLTTQIESAAKEMDSILSTNKSGLSFDKALEEYKTLSAKFNDLGSFDTVFSYDAVLGKYVYTQDGLQKAIQAREQNLQATANRLTKETEIYTNKIIETTPEGNISTLTWDSWDSEEDTLKELEDYKDQIEDKSLIPYYQNLIKGFWASSDYSEKNWYNYMDYVEKVAQQDSKEAEAAQKILQEYQANKKNQYYQAIDWTKLALGTDISGTNKNLMESLAKELGILVEDFNETGVKIGEHWIEGYQGTWEEVLDKYLKETYKDENARKIAETALNGQIKQQQSQSISTAITELLNGAGSAISEETAALLYANGQFEGKLDSKGLLNTGLNYVQSALDLFEATKSELTTAAERNASYREIIDKKFSEANAGISLLSSGASLDSSSVENFFTTIGKNLDDFYNAATNTWAEGIATTDVFGKTRINDWNAFVKQITSNMSDADLINFTTSFEYKNAYSSYVDGLITLDTQMTELIKKNYDNAFNSITGWKPSNVAYLSNTQFFKDLASEGIIDADALQKEQLVIKDIVVYAQRISELFLYLSSLDSEELYTTTGWTQEDLAKNWKNAQTVITAAQDALIGISENISSLNVDQISTLAEKSSIKLEDLSSDGFTKIGDNYVLLLTEYQNYLAKTIAGVEYKDLADGNLKKKVDDAYNKAEQAIFDKISNLNWEKIISGTATDVEQSDFINELQTSLQSLGISLDEYYQDNTLDISGLKEQLKLVDSNLAKNLYNHISEVIAEIQNNILSSITSAATYSIEGTNDITNMQKFVDEYNKLIPNSNISIAGAFEYDTILDQFTLSSNILNEYIKAQKEQLKNLGMSGKAIDEYIKDQTQTILQQNMDVTSILSDTDKRGRQQAGQALVNQLEKIAPMLIEEENKNFEETQKRWKNYPLILNNLTKIHEETLKEINSPVEQVQKLYNGGKEAVKILKRIKGEQISSEEIQTVYRAAMDRLNEASDQLTKGIGETVSGTAATILQAANYGLEELDDGTYVIKTIGDMVKAYNILYQTMAKTDIATTAELNSTYAKMLTAYDQPEIDAISTLNDAMGMTYEALGEMLGRYGIKLADVMNNAEKWGLQSLGNGKIQIYDFKTFASQMHWNPDSEEYLSAFSAYNDALIELNGKAEKAVVEEVKNLKEAKIGDKLNFTYLWNKIQTGIQAKLESENWKDYISKAIEINNVHPEQSGAEGIAKHMAWDAKQRNEAYYTQLEENFAKYGATFEDGILTIEANANIQGIIDEISRLAAENANLLPNELAELNDLISDYIDNIITLIKNGISGNLKNVDAQKLQSWADQFHLNLDFTQTAEGLKLSQESAIKLYNALSGIDNIKAKLVFNELNSSLKESNEHYKSISSIMQHIVELNKLIEETQNKINEENKERSEVKIQQYKEELALAQEILAVRSTSEDEGFSFMSNKIPGAQNNPLNYYSNWASAIQKLQEAMKTSSKTSDGITHKGLIDYQDWYNIATEMGNMAKVTGNEFELAGITIDGSLEKTAALIEKGASALTVDSTGNLKVALGDIGINFEAGAGAMSDGIDTGIKKMARSQVEMLNGLIAMLELIVSMEQLGDIDVDENGISFDELFEFDETGAIKGFSQGYQNWIDYVTKEIQDDNKDLENALKGISFGDYSLLDMLGWTTSDFEEKATNEIQQLYPALLQALKTAAESGEWNLDNIGQSLVDILKQSGFDGTIPLDIGDTTLLISGNTTTTINWQDKDVQNILKQIDENTEEAREKAKNWLQAYSNGEGLDEKKLTYVLALNGNIKYDINGNVTGITVNGKTYSAEGEEFSPAKYAQVLVDAGIDFDTDKAIKEAAANGEKSISVPVEMGLQTDVYVTSDENGIEWHYDGGIFKTKQAMLDSAWEYYAGHRGIDANDQKTKNKYLWEEWGVREHITAKVTGKNGVEIDTATDASARQAIENKISNLTAKDLELDDTGNLNIDLGNDMHISLSGDVVVDENGNPVEAKVIEQLKKKLNIDLQLVDTIKVGVTAALTELPDIKFDADTQVAFDKINALKDAAKEINSDLKLGTNEVNTNITANKTTAISNPAKQDIKVGINEVRPRIDSNKTYATNNPAVQNVITNEGTNQATGTVGLAKAQGTLMGELGPELYVQNGRYFVAGQNGPEFVDLAPDAIVFNHLQTRSLLDKGMSPGRGKAVTNERTAVSYAKGNVNGGPAMASASAALAALKQLRAQWNALAQLSTKDLASKGGGGGGGKNDPANFLKDLEKWYNWLQKIAQLEKDITYEESLRNRIASDFNADGLKYYQSQRRSLKDLTEEIATQQDLLESQSKYFEERRAEMNSAENPFTALYTFDENGQLKYQDGALAKLSDLVGRNKLTGEANYTAAEQYQKLVEMGYGAYMEYDSSGNKIDQKEDNWEEKAVQAFWDKVDADQSEMQSLHDSIEDLKNNIENNTQKQNEILKAIEDNQIAVENKVYGALVDLKERTIKELKDQRNAIEKANKDLIDGLNKNLERERQLYANSESDKELTTLQRQLAILQRSGGSASDIANLQNQIASKQKDVYFETQQQEIDALQDASDAQLERLDKQIELEEETLEYQKAHGMLWEQVKEIMMGSPEEIAAYIKENNSSYWGKSSTDLAQTLRKDLFEAEQWKAFYGGDESIQNLVQSINDEVAEKRESEKKIEEKKEEEKAITTSTKATSTTSTSTGGTPSPKKESDEYDTYQFDAQYHWKKKDKSDKEKHIYPVITNGAKCKTCGYTLASYTPGNTNSNSTTSNNKVEDKIKASTSAVSNIGKGIEKLFHSILGFDEGGTVNYTGLAMVHGTKKKPEHMLSAEAFAAAKDYMNNIESFGSKITSNWLEILSLRESMESQKDAIRQIMNSNTNAESSIIIEHAEVNMHVDKLANSYDSARAADDVMKEMINIARKTNAQNRIGR